MPCRSIYPFDHPHETSPKDLEGPARGKGANLAEMTSVLRLPVPPGVHHHHRGVPGAPRGRRLARRPRRRDRRPARPHRACDGPATGRSRGSPAGERAVGGQVLDAGDDGHRLEPGPQRRVGRRDWRRRPATSASPSTRTVGSWPCSAASSSASTARRFDRLLDDAKRLAGVTNDAEVPTELLRYLVQRSQQVVQSESGEPFPQDPTRQLRRRSRPCSTPGTGPGPSPTAPASTSPTTWAPR